MSNIRRKCSVVICGAVIIGCCIFYSIYSRNIVVTQYLPYPLLEEYSIEMTDTVPEELRDEYADFIDAVFADEVKNDHSREVIKVTWCFTNITDSTISMRNVWISYNCCDKIPYEWLHVLGQNGDLIWVSDDDFEILPPGEHITIEHYVIAAEDMHEIKASLGADYRSEQDRIPREEFWLIF